MRHVVRKLFWVWNYDKEEKWLNEMAAKGLCLISVGFGKFEFEDCDPGEYRICLQMLEKRPRHIESRRYIEFVESTGAEHVGTFARWIYFRKKATDGDFAMFSDYDSRIKHLNRIITFVGLVSLANLLIGTGNVIHALASSYPISDLNYSGLLNIAIGILGSFGTWRLLKKRNKLKAESQLFE